METFEVRVRVEVAADYVTRVEANSPEHAWAAAIDHVEEQLLSAPGIRGLLQDCELVEGEIVYEPAVVPTDRPAGWTADPELDPGGVCRERGVAADEPDLDGFLAPQRKLFSA